MRRRWQVASLLAVLAVLAVLVAGCSSGQAAKSSDDGTQSSASGEASTSEDTTASTASTDTSGAPDYSKESSWYQIPEVTKDVDTFYVYASMYTGQGEGDPDYAALDNAEMLEGLQTEHVTKISVFEDSTNVYVPYYRQASLKVEADAWKKTGDARSTLTGIPYEDVTAALDYYFENYNDGRPFILASHSQGSAINSLVLKGYFKEHPEYYERMVAAYIVGFSITKDDLEANPHLKFATGEDDAGVIVSWHTEGPKNVEENVSMPVLLSGGISINPLNWKLDDTYAPASENKGSLVIDMAAGKTVIQDIGADAQVVPSRGTVVTNAKTEPKEAAELFGPQGYHEDDYSIFYNNVKDNVAKRIATYQASK